MLKTSESTESLTQPRKDGFEVGGDNRAKRDRNELDESEVDGNEVGDNKVGNKVWKLSKSKNLFKYKKMVGSYFLTSGAKLAFTKLR